MRTASRLAVVAVLLAGTLALATAVSGQVTTTATLSVSIEVQGASGAPPELGALEITPLVLQVAERACGGPTFLATFLDGAPADVPDVPAGVAVVDAAELRVDVQVPAGIDGTPCEYTVDPTASFLCYQAVDVVAGPDGSGPVLNLAGAPTGEAVAPAEGAVVDVVGRYTDSCAELRIVVDGLGGRTLQVVLDSTAVDPADVSRTCDYGDVGPSPVVLDHESGLVVLDSRVAGCSAVLTVLVDGCTVTPTPDSFTVAQPVTERRFTAACAQVPPPVVEEPTFTG